MSKTESIFREFPFLSKFISKTNLSSFQVCRVDGDLLNQKRQVWSLAADTAYERVVLLDREGNELTRLGKFISTKKHWWQWKKGFYIERVADAILYLKEKGTAKEVFFVLSIFMGDVVIYKSPKGFTILEYFEERMRRERQAVQRVIAKI